MTQGMLVILGQKKYKKTGDFADLSSDELIGGYDSERKKSELMVILKSSIKKRS